jgi:hypothetical protein
MSRISQNALVSAIKVLQGMDMQQKALLADEIFREQPNLLGSVLVLPQLGVSMQKVEFALEILFVCFNAMKASGWVWPIISEDDLDRQSRRFTAIIHFADDLNKRLRDDSMQQYLASHPEKELLAYVQSESAKWTARIVPEETDKYVMLAAWNMVNCLAFVVLPESRATPIQGHIG